MRVESKTLDILGVAFCLIVTSLYFFPFTPVLAPIANTKMVMAVISIPLVIIDAIRERKEHLFDQSFIFGIIFALLVSIMSYTSMTVNHTPDDEFVSYFVSVFVWLGGAYTATRLIRLIHGNITLGLVCDYVIGVCVMQCALAYACSAMPGFETFVNAYIGGHDNFFSLDNLTSSERLFGIGCGLDPSGLRMAGVLVIVAARGVNAHRSIKTGSVIWYILAYFTIVTIGSMISRSVIVGLALSMVYLAVSALSWDESRKASAGKFWKTFFWCLVPTVIVCTVLYNTNENFRSYLEFGFEGFFSLVREGEWDVGSNNVLKNMVIFPDNPHTWIIGDGYIGNAMDDQYYLGSSDTGYYMGTDIGYLRYIFYFGVVGLLCLMAVFAFFTATLCRRFPRYRWMFLLLLLTNYIGWFKVTSDIIMIFTILLVTAFQTTVDDPEPLEGSKSEAESVPRTSYRFHFR